MSKPTGGTFEFAGMTFPHNVTSEEVSAAVGFQVHVGAKPLEEIYGPPVPVAEPFKWKTKDEYDPIGDLKAVLDL